MSVGQNTFETEVLLGLADIRERIARVEQRIEVVPELEDRVVSLERSRDRATAKMATVAAMFAFIEPILKTKMGWTFLP
ncbi:hypothetical protein [Acetobacter sp. UBA5411]|uniref:hypothetical protein n=1 Tax=Acetobacter sp. UBA5411 TaxID=1945905 RepID=UPI0025BABA72|nr:hypothetical protein [Acetobacter sp. UBA5411]